MAGDHGGGVQRRHRAELAGPVGPLLCALGVGRPKMQTGEHVHAAGDRADRRNPHVAAVRQAVVEPADLEGLVFQRDRAACQHLGQRHAPGRVDAHPRPPDLELVGQRRLDLPARGRRAHDPGLGEVLAQHIDAEVEVGIGLGDEDGLQRLPAVEHHRGDAQRIGTGEAGIEQDRVRLAGDQYRVDVETRAICVVDLHAERSRRLRHGAGGHDAQRHHRGKQGKGKDLESIERLHRMLHRKGCGSTEGLY